MQADAPVGSAVASAAAATAAILPATPTAAISAGPTGNEPQEMRHAALVARCKLEENEHAQWRRDVAAHAALVSQTLKDFGASMHRRFPSPLRVRTWSMALLL